MTKRLLIVVNVDWFFLSHRLPVALEAARQGYEVHVAVGITDQKTELESYGFKLHPINISRGHTSLISEIRSFLQIWRLFRQIRPHVVHLVTIKPVLFGGIASRLARVPAVVAAISGLGFVFVDKSLLAHIRRIIIGFMYRLALQRPQLKVIFQNPDDQRCLVRLTKLPDDHIEIIRGSGVDLSKYVPAPWPQGTPLVIMACRLIVDKGVWEFVNAAHLLRERGVNVRFVLVGSIDPDNPASLSEEDLEKIKREGNVELWGMRSDMEIVIAQSHLFVLPSYYGEGLPKVLIEAAACGRPIVTTDMPGCRDAVIAGETALLVPTRDRLSLADAIHTLLNDPERCRQMGEAGRRLAEREFDIRSVISKHLHIYQALLDDKKK